MTHGVEYLVCISQGSKVTFVNNAWQGRERTHDLQSCPDLCAFLQQAGAEGWDLVSAYAVTVDGHVHEKLFLKRLR